MDEFRRAGERAFNLKRLIDLKHSLTAKDDTLPPRIVEKLPDLKDEERRVPTDIQSQVGEYYAVRGWDEMGVPTRQKLRNLGL